MCEENSALLEALAEREELEELEEKHWGECVQIAQYDDELKRLREDIAIIMKYPMYSCRMCKHWDSREKCNGCEPEYNMDWRRKNGLQS